MDGRSDQGVLAGTLPLDGLLPEALLEMASAARAEARAEMERSTDRTVLEAGLLRGAVGAEQVWSFEIVGDDDPPPETPGQLLVESDEGEQHVSCRVLATGNGTILLGVRADLGLSVNGAMLSLDAGFVTVRLAERLEALASGGVDDAGLVTELLQPDPEGHARIADPDNDGDDHDSQATAVRRAVAPGLRFTWGPPGTGKTGVLARAVALAASRGDRVLVLAHANAAVDVATLRIAAEMPPAEVPGRLLRVGTPHSPEVIGRPDVLPDHLVAEGRPDLISRRHNLVEQRRRLSDQARLDAPSDPGWASAPVEPATTLAPVGVHLRSIRKDLTEVEDQLAEARRGLISGAQVVVTTIAKALVDDHIWNWPADVVVIDEASMAPYPALVALAALGPRTLSCVGDFRQLPPVVISNERRVQRLFGRDVFDHAEVISTFEARRPDPRLTALRTQHRMGEQICRTVSRFAYDGLLDTSRQARNRAIRLARGWPGADNEIVVVDTTGIGASCSRPTDPADRSRYGLLSAALALGAAERMGADGDRVAVLSPYRAQVDLLRAAATDRATTVSTIHRFQGSEQDAVIVDLVDAPGADGASRLTGTDADLSRRLLNVAVSRARGKLVLLAHLGFLDQFHPRTSRSRQLVQAAVESGAEVLPARTLVADLIESTFGSARWYPDRATALGSQATGRDGPANDAPAARLHKADHRGHAVASPHPLGSREVSPVTLVAAGPTSAVPRRWEILDGTRVLVAGEGATAVVQSAPLVAALHRLTR